MGFCLVLAGVLLGLSGASGICWVFWFFWFLLVLLGTSGSCWCFSGSFRCFWDLLVLARDLDGDLLQPGLLAEVGREEFASSRHFLALVRPQKAPSLSGEGGG